jgi:L-cysteine S-thiosulfotransferase
MYAKSTLLLTLLAFLSISYPSIAADEDSKATTGQEVAFSNKLGNCLACHAIPNDPKVKSPGDIGPALIGIKQRYPDRAKLRAQIWDATANNPKTSMPPFGKNKILTETEIDMVTDYIYGM